MRVITATFTSTQVNVMTDSSHKTSKRKLSTIVLSTQQFKALLETARFPSDTFLRRLADLQLTERRAAHS